MSLPGEKGLTSTGWQVAEIFVAVHWFAGAKEAGSGKVAGLAKVWEMVKGGFCPSSSDAENGIQEVGDAEPCTEHRRSLAREVIG